MKLEARHSLKATNEIDSAIQAMSDEELDAVRDAMIRESQERGCPNCINCDDPHLCRIIAEIGHWRRVES